jgi:hypothetical protein
MADFVKAVINNRVPQNTGRFLTSLATASFFINDFAPLGYSVGKRQGVLHGKSKEETTST